MERNNNNKPTIDGKALTIKEQLIQAFKLNPDKRKIEKIFEENPLLLLEYEIVYSDTDPDFVQVKRHSNEEIELAHKVLLSKTIDERERRSLD